MNNREKRLKYIKDNFKLEHGNYCEECFIVSVINNQFAMDFVRKEINKLDDLESTLSFALNDILKYDLQVIYSNGYKKIDAIKEVLAYIAYAEITENLIMIEKLIKKSHSKLYKIINDGEYFTLPSITEGNIIAFICSFKNDTIYDDDCEFIEIINETVSIYLQDFTIINIKNTLGDMENKFKDLYEKFKLKKTITFRDIASKFHVNFRNLFINHLRTLGFDEDAIVREGANNFFGENGWENKLLKNNVIDNKGYKLFRLLTEISGRFCINYEDITNRVLSKEDVVNILSLIDICDNSHFLNSTDFEFYFLLVSYIYIILKDSTNKSSTIVELAVQLDQERSNNFSNNRKIIEENSSLKEENNLLKHQILDKNKEIEELKRRLNDSNAKINALQNEKSKIENNKEELIALRELFFSLENTEPDVVPIKNVDLNIDDFNIAFVGGSDNLQLKVKELFPSFTMVSSEEQTRDLSFLKNMNYVFLHTHMPHALYYKVIDILRINNINFSFLNEVNVDILSKKIITKLS